MAFKYDYNQERNSVEWQRKVDEIRQRDDYTCQVCGTKEEQVHVHHTWYNHSLHYWEYPNHQYITLCGRCHEQETILCKKFKDIKPHIDVDVWEAVCKMIQDGIPLLKLVHLLNLIDENNCLPSKPEHTLSNEYHNIEYNTEKRKRAFIKEVQKFESKYGKEYVETFIDYWTEVSKGVLRFDANKNGKVKQPCVITEQYISLKLDNWQPEYKLILKKRESKPILQELDIKLKNVEDYYKTHNIELQCRDIDSGTYNVSDRLLGKLLFEKGLYLELLNGDEVCVPIQNSIINQHETATFLLLYETNQAFKENKKYNQTILSSLDSQITYKTFCLQYNIKLPKNFKHDKSIQELVNSQDYPIKIEYCRGCVSLKFRRSSHSELFFKLNEIYGLKLLTGITHFPGGHNIRVPFNILYKMDGLQFDFRNDSFEHGTMQSIQLPPTYKDISFYIEKINNTFRK